MADYIEKFKDAIPKAIAQAWSDPAFDSLLISNPDKALKSLGVTLPPHVDLRFIKADGASSSNWTMTEVGGKHLVTVPLPSPPGGSSGAVQAHAGCSSSSICCTG